MELYNVTPYISTLPLGIAAAMEEKRAEDIENFDTDSITNVKTAFMGPLSGIGDSIYWGTIRVIAMGIGTSLAIKGNILGPILFGCVLTYQISEFVIFLHLSAIGLAQRQWNVWKNRAHGKRDAGGKYSGTYSCRGHDGGNGISDGAHYHWYRRRGNHNSEYFGWNYTVLTSTWFIWSCLLFVEKEESKTACYDVYSNGNWNIRRIFWFFGVGKKYGWCSYL